MFISHVAGVGAHHAGHTLSVRSPRCGWVDGDDIRDRRNASDFCTRWVQPDLRISNASANHERLWIETPSGIASTLLEDDRMVAGLLRTWLEHWRETTGYKTASVILVRNHIEFARIETTMTGYVVSVRRFR